MHQSMQTPVANAFNFISPNFNSSILDVSQMAKQEDKAKSLDFLEELKCLFLRVRNPNKSVFVDLVWKMFNCDINSAEGTNWLQAANRNFIDSHNKFLDAVEKAIDDFNEERAR
jgi:hypothetical protein